MPKINIEGLLWSALILRGGGVDDLFSNPTTLLFPLDSQQSRFSLLCQEKVWPIEEGGRKTFVPDPTKGIASVA